MFSNAKVNLILHGLAQIIAQSAIVEYLQNPFAKSLAQLAVAIVGVLVAFSDQSISKTSSKDDQSSK